MDVKKAMQLLGVTETTPVAEVTKVFRRLSKKHHPDVSGDGDLQAQLNQAHRLLLDHHDKKAVIPTGFQELAELVTRNNQVMEQSAIVQRRAVEVQEAKRNADDLTQKIAKRVTRLLQLLKYMAFLGTAVTAAVGWLSGEAMKLDAQTLTPEQLYKYKIVAICLGAVSAVLQFLVADHNHRVGAYNESLGDEEFCIEELNRFGLSKREFVIQDLSSRLANRALFFREGPLRMNDSEALRLTLFKALELGILERPAGSKRRYRVSDEYADQFHFERPEVEH
ncbi:J domain-containing protein [Mesorhizobium sp. M4A.F.Ca.ET.020.02.1.1]|uniref:J domain-containing protein n=1 Tax=unclassified Mesorhizobium TaxID=325217 RepID=UPI000FD357EB|nr:MULTISPECIES: J domain-containing protein [unclassified Mesorhizobium]RVD32535.1 J domain-containing protein [Mesorhizobium sp. M4A.F.Ca.ET.020.02.1.1]RWC20890.1 MAG: J domain-containing protein [Mesorhizobium sp.]